MKHINIVGAEITYIRHNTDEKTISAVDLDGRILFTRFNIDNLLEVCLGVEIALYVNKEAAQNAEVK